MRLISCYVAHFGKITDFSYDFNEGFNPILQENGWGKTTFSVFIKAMFYGLEYSPNTKKLIERNHYLPWDGSLCGGSIVFGIKDKVYRVERSFGKSDKDDSFAIYDNNTGLETNDYSANLGEEIFKVDRDSFEKSVYIPQLSLDTRMTDSLNAKMGGLSTTKDDIKNFDKALSAVKNAKSEYTKTTKVNPGKLTAVRREINKCKEDYEKLPHIVEGYESQSCLIEEKQERLDALTNQKASLIEQIQAQSKREQDLGAYKTYKENLVAELETLAKLDDFFAAGIPDEDELAMLEQTDRDLAVHERAYVTLAEEQKRGAAVFAKPFEERLPDESEFSMWNRMATKLSELRAKAEHAKLSDEAAKQLTELKFFFDKLIPTDEQLSHIEHQTTQISALEGRIAQANERLMQLKAERDAEEKLSKHKSSSVGKWIGIILFILFVVAAIIFIPYLYSTVGKIVVISAAAAAIVDLLLTIILGKRSKSSKAKLSESYEERIASDEKELSGYEEELSLIKEECDRFLSNFLLTRADTMTENVYEIRRKLDQYNHLLEEEAAHQSINEGTLDELADVQLELYTKIQPFANAYGINLYDMGGEYEFLAQLKKDADKYAKYLYDMQDMQRHENTIHTMRDDINKILDRYPVSKELERSEQISEISHKTSQYKAIAERIEGLKKNIADFEANYEVSDAAKSVDDLQAMQNDIDEQIVELNKQIIQDKENMSRNADEIERLNDVADQIDRLTEQEKEYKAKVELLDQTADFLTKARESFLLKYMEPLQTGLHKYLGLLDSPDGTSSGYAVEDFELDMELGIKLKYSGSTKTADYLSQGYQDLVALCSRLALVDVLYSDEKPILILDDPFTNLDEKKIKESIKLLEEISKERQTIYFTCHDSRM